MFMPFPWRRHFVRSAPRPSTRLSLEALEARTLLSTSPSSLVVDPLNGFNNVNIAQSSQGQAETTIAIDPINPINHSLDLTDSYLFAASNAPPVAGSNHFAAYSSNEGVTWTLSNVSTIPKGGYDEQATFDQYGNLFLTYLAGSNVVVAWSADGGKTFAGYKVLGPGDQPSISTGYDPATGKGSVWVSYQNGGYIQASGAAVSGPLYTRTNTVGTFSKPQNVTGSAGGDYGDTKVGLNGDVMVTYQNPIGVQGQASGQGPSTIYVNLYTGGVTTKGKVGTFLAPVTVTTTNVGGYATIPAQPSDTIDAEANLAWGPDPSNASNPDGRVYLVYTNRPTLTSAATDIYVTFSENDGTTWSQPVRVNDDGGPLGDGKSHFLPAIAVDHSTGFVAVTWYDARNSTTNTTAQIYGTVSTDGGLTWIPNVQIGAGLSNGVAAGNFNFGDYDTMDYANGVFYRSWADNSSTVFQYPNAHLPDMTPATARVSVVATTSVVTSGAGASPALSQTQGFQGASAPATPGPATSKGSQSVVSAEQNSESIDHLFTAAGKAGQGAVWFRWTHGDLGGAGSDPTDGLATDEVFQTVGGL